MSIEKVDRKSEDQPYKGNTIVGNDVWIGYEAVIMPGVQVGDGAIISAKSVVVSDVPPYTIFGGNPARCIRQRFDDEVIRSLLEIAWWNWSREKIEANMQYFYDDVESFIERFWRNEKEPSHS